MFHGQFSKIDGSDRSHLRVLISVRDNSLSQPLALLVEPTQVLGSLTYLSPYSVNKRMLIFAS